MHSDDISKYSDLFLKYTDNAENINNIFQKNGMEIKNDLFNDYCKNKHNNLIYEIKKDSISIGFAALWNINEVNKNANIYGFVIDMSHYFDLVKSILSALSYLFDVLKYNKATFIYRDDNRIYNEICTNLNFFDEGLLRNHIYDEGKFHDVEVKSLLAHEYRRLYHDKYKRMFTWQEDFATDKFAQIDITHFMNDKACASSIDNKARANFNGNDEFILNKYTNNDNVLSYKNINFRVEIFNNNCKHDNISCNEQHILLERGYYENILVVVTAQMGYQKSYIKIINDDDSIDELPFNVNDWCVKILNDEYLIYNSYGCRIIKGRGNRIKSDCFIYLKRIQLYPNKIIKGIILPDNRYINIFGMGICKA